MSNACKHTKLFNCEEIIEHLRNDATETVILLAFEGGAFIKVLPRLKANHKT